MNDSPQFPLLRLILVSSVLFAVAIAARADQPGHSLSIQFAARSVGVSGAGPGNTVVVFGVGIDRHGQMPLLTREVQSLEDQDGDGRVAFPVRRVPQRSVWVAVDLNTGEHVVATPDGAAPVMLNDPAEGWQGGVEAIDVGRAYLEVLLVRPHVGAWALRTADGGPNDGDGFPNGVLRLSLGRMKPFAGEVKGPGFAIPKDLIVVVDPHTLELLVREAQ